MKIEVKNKKREEGETPGSHIHLIRTTPNHESTTVPYLDEVLDFLVDGSLIVVGAHGKPSDLSHESVVGDTAYDSGSRSLGAARSEEGQVLIKKKGEMEGGKVNMGGG